jgi:hypothetical protein
VTFISINAFLFVMQAIKDNTAVSVNATFFLPSKPSQPTLEQIVGFLEGSKTGRKRAGGPPGKIRFKETSVNSESFDPLYNEMIGELTRNV